MLTHIINKYIPMTETAYLILLSLSKENHGYGVILEVEKMTKGRIRIGPGTIYGTLSKMEADGLIIAIREENRRKIYKQTQLAIEVMQVEIKRIEELYQYGLEWRLKNERL
ncbi:PadR family transcriptional regulator [Fusibacter ferrireducens]|uniref:PadR family transcriptional regulator n=1 Tax=Fusibacter ferrireducens TaxID=2785058 RepID=A0ABR9ZVF9_9FIRM|nr:PadR family transcriptional regulator [Fusibacter ferrireducens]MBF4694158.1 PadR family transcriptional regulator [Fusibacter ferrireducens]